MAGRYAGLELLATASAEDADQNLYRRNGTSAGPTDSATAASTNVTVSIVLHRINQGIQFFGIEYSALICCAFACCVHAISEEHNRFAPGNLVQTLFYH